MAEELEPFEVTDWDIENEFNPDRVKRKLTKKQHIYGIWASDDSDSERPSFGGKNKRDFSAPISFISGGIKHSGQKEKKEPDTANKDSSSDEENKSCHTTQSGKNQHITGFSGSTKPHHLAGLRPGQAFDRDFGSWEKHTKGIGQKLLLQMGYQPGRGLGKELQGIRTPIEAKKRQGKGALGLYGPEQKQRPVPLIEAESETEDDIQYREQLRQWKKKPGEIKKVKYAYRTVDEVAAEGLDKKLKGDKSALSCVKVIDMTGPEQRVLLGYHQIHQQHSKPEDKEISLEQKTGKGHHFALPELLHNLSLLVDMTEQEIIHNDRELSHEKDRVVNLKHEEERLLKIIEQEEQQMKILEEILQILNSLDEKSKEECGAPLSLDDALLAFKDLQEKYYEEYKIYHLSDMAITIVCPLIKKYLETWDPVNDPHYGLNVFKNWKDILESEEKQRLGWSTATDEDMDPYHQMVWDVWLPCIRKALSSWNVHHCDPVIELLETWMPLLPIWIMNNVLEQLIFPHLQKEVEEWNPLTDTLPIHSWLHPWLPLMGERLEPLYPPIRHKLANALTNWHPSDCSAKLILEPWRPVFSQGTMEAFVVNNIVPKLALALQNFVINPHQQHLDVWHWVMAWEDLLPEQCLVTLLEKNFFPRWLQVLCAWLNHSPNYEEVTKWYMGWKSMLSPSLFNNSIIKDQFKRALDIMNRAVSSPQGLLGYQPGARESMAYLANIERQQELENQVEKSKRNYEALSQSIRGASSTTSLSLSFKDLIEKKAEESNILFVPVPNRYQEGKQVYRFGRIIMYLDRGVIFVFNEKTWVPTSLQSLLDMAG